MFETIESYLKRTDIYLYIWTALLLVLGILLIVSPDSVMTFLSVFFGIVLLLSGASQIITFFMIGKDETGSFQVRRLTTGILMVVIGLYTAARPQIMVNIAGVILAIFLIVYGIYELIWSFRVHFISGTYRLLSMLSAICAVVVGIMFILSPASGTRTLTQFAGILLLYAGISSAYFHILARKTVRDVKKRTKKAVENYREQMEDYIDVDDPQ